MGSQFQNESTVSGTLGFVIRISQIFGVASLKIENVRNKWLIRVSRAAGIYGRCAILIISILTVACVIWDVILDTWSFHTLTHMDTIMLTAMASAVTSTLLAQAISGIYRMQSIITSLNQIRKINVELSLYRQPNSDEKRIRIWTMLSLISSFILFIIDYRIFISRAYITHGNLYIAALYISRYIEYAMLKVLTKQITLIFLTVLDSFKHLNDCLDNLLEQMVRTSTSKINKIKYPDPAMIQNLGLLYSSLCDVVQNLDNSHGIVLVPMIASSLIHLVVTPYNFITKIFGNTTDFYYAMLQVPWIVYHGWDLIMIVEPCHRTQLQMDRTKHLISQLLRVSLSEHHKLLAELKLFYKHAMANEAVYAPFHLFQLNRGLLLTILGSVTTYLVVVVKL